jgi:acyl-CoA thioesterase-1
LAWALLLVLAASGAPAGLARERPVLLVVGDSLSAAYGIESARGWVALLEARLQARGYPHQVVNASISGDTTRGGRSRLPAALERHAPALVVLALGGNDGLRGLPLAETERNLAAMIEASRARGARLLLVGIRLPPNYGAAYTQGFEALYPRLAREQGVPLVPFLLEGVADRPELMQADGIHPREEAQAQLLETVWGGLAPLLGLAP